MTVLETINTIGTLANATANAIRTYGICLECLCEFDEPHVIDCEIGLALKLAHAYLLQQTIGESIADLSHRCLEVSR